MAIHMPFPADVNPKARRPRSARAAKRWQMPNPFSLCLWLLATLLVFGCLALSGCRSAQAQEPGASAVPKTSPRELRRLAANEFACPGMHAEWEGATVRCFKEKP